MSQTKCDRCGQPAAPLTTLLKNPPDPETWKVCENCFLRLAIERFGDAPKPV